MCATAPLQPTPSSLPISFSNDARLRVVAELAADRCVLNLRQSPDDIALHVSLRLDKGALVLNSRLGGVWGEEESQGGLPFGRGRIFTLDFKPSRGFASDALELSANGQVLASFNLRSDVYSIDSLEIESGFRVHSVQIFP